MAIESFASALADEGTQPAPLDASRLIVNLSESLKPLPTGELRFGELKTDHMLIAEYDPVTGWSAPEIRPYSPLSIDPMSSCIQFCSNVFEGMKAYRGPNGEIRLFRPNLNMERLKRSVERVALPPFDTNVLLVLIKRLISIEKRWMPTKPGHSLYIRPTVIGTRASFGVAPSDSAILFVVLSPSGAYFRNDAKGISLLAFGKTVRSWPGGTGGHKLGVNYAPGFLAQRDAMKQGYSQILWLLGDEHKITEAGAMNFFIVAQREDGDLDIVTPPLDGTILPGVTRQSCLELLDAHTAQRLVLPGVHASCKLHTHERILTMPELVKLSDEGRILEAFGVGTAVIVAPVGRIGWEGKDLIFPSEAQGLGIVGKALLAKILDIQSGVGEWNGWSQVCEN